MTALSLKWSHVSQHSAGISALSLCIAAVPVLTVACTGAENADRELEVEVHLRIYVNCTELVL